MPGGDLAKEPESLFAVHTRHDEVEQDQIDERVVRAEVTHGLLPVGATGHFVAETAKRVRNEGANELLVVHHEDMPFPTDDARSLGSARFRLGARRGDGEPEGRPLPWAAVDSNPASQALDAAVDARQSQPRPPRPGPSS